MDIEFLKKGVQTIPVSNEVLSKLIYMGSWNELEIMSYHPGYKLNRDVESLERALETYQSYYQDLIEMLNDFDTASKDSTLFLRSRAGELKTYEIECRKLIFSLSCAVATLVDLERRVEKVMKLSDHSMMLEKCFDNNHHEFIKQIRNNLNHETFFDANWALRNIGENQTSHFEFSKEKLLHDGSFNEKAQKYIQNQADHIDVRNLFETYNESIDAFYKWLMLEIENKIHIELHDYRRCIRKWRANGIRLSYHILFKQVIKPDTDLYSHLHKYLTSEELEEINSMPYRSPEQVDRIIEMVDEYGACNNEMRELIYSAFKVPAISANDTNE